MEHLIPTPSHPFIDYRAVICWKWIAGCYFAARLSGAHQPRRVAGILGWGKMHHHDIVGYIIGQFLSAIIGAALLVFMWGGMLPVS